MSEIHTASAPEAATEGVAVTRGGRRSSGSRMRLGGQLNKFGGVLMLAALILVFGLLRPDTFLTTSNATSILSAQSITAILALGLLFPLAAGAFDLSAAQNLGFSGVLCGYLMAHSGWAVPLAMVATLAVGALIGVVNGILVAVIGIDSFIATLGTSSLLLAGSQIIGNGKFIGPFPGSFLNLTAKKVFGLPITVVYVAVFALIVWYALEHSPLGRRTYATGANPDAARLSGVATSRMVFGSLVFSGIVAAVAGITTASTLGAVNENIGPEYLLPAFAAVFLGTTMLKPGRFNVGGTLLAILVLGTGVAGLQLIGGPVWVIALFNGIALIVAVGAGLMLRRLQNRRAIRRTARAARQAAKPIAGPAT